MSRVVDRSKRTCFSIMPFNDDFNDIDAIIKSSAEECGLEYVRADHHHQPGSIMSRILHEIHAAAVVVADISGHNPNVFYELGIAHQIKGPDRVVMITRRVDDKKAFDVHHLHQLVYTHTDGGRKTLRVQLPKAIRNAIASNADQDHWNVIRGRLPRTRMIVRDLRRLTDDVSSKDLKNVTIRIVAGLSSLAISNDERVDYQDDIEYFTQLIAERNALRNLLARGARLKAVLKPPRQFARDEFWGRLQKRYKRLIGLLERAKKAPRTSKDPDLIAIRRCEFALCPIPLPNWLIIGDSVAYEGVKRGLTGGFEMTHCESTKERVGEMIKQFDELFKVSRREMVEAHGRDGGLIDQLKSSYNAAIESERARGRRLRT